MKRTAILVRSLVLLLGLVALSQTAGALERGQLGGGIVFASGGIGLSERQALHAERSRYSLWVSTVAQGSGAYLAGATLRIVSLDGDHAVLEHTMAGPWFFAALSPGRYKVTASLAPDDGGASQQLSSDVRIRRGDHRQVVLRFASSADVAPDRERPFGGNPFGGPGTSQ
jgi:hypothetical protein